ncbi:hypothetical protein E2C01_064795 [Portunus trituberculatus]|uniref:Uncharacterized protein n=1 Tax=Portunus trituberculatus TaxID=210409 RepID=A0A5B7HPT0_PORTR|nr:hypothetical protein [Portunus trituberculatus]
MLLMPRERPSRSAERGGHHAPPLRYIMALTFACQPLTLALVDLARVSEWVALQDTTLRVTHLCPLFMPSASLACLLLPLLFMLLLLLLQGSCGGNWWQVMDGALRS